MSVNHDRIQLFREKLDSLSISDYHGLDSPGLTCYLNSVLQVLFMTEDFREAVKRCCSKDSTAIDPHLDELFTDLQIQMARTHNVTKKLGIINVYEQRDAAEYFEKILCLASPEASKIFKGELNHKTTCLRCKKTNESRNFFWVLPLAVEDSCRQTYSVEKGLKAFFKGEQVCGENRLYCNCCQNKQDADIGCEMTQNPKILTLLLKRFSFDYKHRCYVKLRCNVDIPQTLHVENCKYDLYALVHHFGNLTGGHYTAQIKSFETQTWYHFNDDIVEGVKLPLFGPGDKSFRSCAAYLLMYRKVRHPEQSDDEGDRGANCAHSDVEAEGKHNEAERGEAPVPHHQLKDGSCNGGEYLKHLNGHDDTVWRKPPICPGELEPRLQTQKSNSAKLQKDGRQRSHEKFYTNSQEHMSHLITGRSPAVLLRTHVDCALEQNHESQKKRLKANGTDWETQNNIDAKTGTETGATHRLTRNGVKPAQTKVVKNQRQLGTEGKRKQKGEAGVSANMCDSDVKSCHVSSHGYSSAPCWTNEPAGYKLSAKLARKSNNSKRNKEEMQHVAIVDHSCRQETKQTARKEENGSVKVPWRR